MKLNLRRALGLSALVFAVAVPTAAGQGVQPDYVSSDNIQLISRLKQAGDGVGARIIGNFMYVTSTTHLTIFDITDAEAPKMMGAVTMDVEFENEDVPTNGKVLGISASIGCETVTLVTNPGTNNCLNLYDVSNPAAPKFVKAVPGAGDHTSECVLDCTYFYGDSGSITDARDLKSAKQVDANWQTIIEDQLGISVGSSHAVREVQPGILVTSTQPIVMMSARPQEGGSPERPVPIAIGETEKFIHSVEWPREGRDKFLLVGGETVLDPSYTRCDDTAASFQVWDASKVVNPATGAWNMKTKFSLIDEIRPVSGQYVDGHAPASVFGCSTHWFKPHPSFKDGGAVAVAQYEDGTRIFQVGENGKLTEQGFFLPLGGATSAPHWHPNGKVIYNIDYERGLDVLRYTGETYVPNTPPTPGATPGTNGAPPPKVDQPECASAAGFREANALPSGKKVRFTTQRRQTKPFTVDVFQQSQGSTVVRERLVARFSNKSEDFVWNGTDRKKRKLKDGRYFVRFTMKLDSGAKDVRRATLNRKRGKFSLAPDFYQRVDCGIFKSLKLDSSVFGGKKKAPLRIAYKLDTGVRSVKLEVKAGGKVVKTFTGGGAQGKTFRFKLPAKLVKKNKEAEVTVTVDRGGSSSPTYVLRAKRI